MVCPGGRGRHLSETNAGAGWLQTGSKSSMGRFLIHIDGQDGQDGQDLQDFFGDGGLAILDIRESADLHRRSPPLVQQPPILIILCILYILSIDVH